MSGLLFASPTHQRAFAIVRDMFWVEPQVMAVSITGSAARNEGAFDSDLDFNLFFADGAPVEAIMGRVETTLNREIRSRRGLDVGRFFDVDLHAAPTVIVPQPRGWTDGPDDFELEIGNIFVHQMLIFERENYFTQAQAAYLPYYSDELRAQRLALALKFCRNNIEHIEPFVRRGLYFQAFRRLYDATLEFLQALFISKRFYPIAYDKWIKKQLVEMLDMPELYVHFVTLYEVQKLESNELTLKGQQLEACIQDYIEDAG